MAIISDLQQKTIVKMYNEEKPVLISYFLRIYKNKRSCERSIEYLTKAGLIISTKNIFGADQKRVCYQLTSRGLQLAEALIKIEERF